MSESQPTILNDEILAYIGRKGPVYKGTVNEEEMQRYAVSVAMGEPNPLYIDQAFANQSVFGGKIAPFHFYSVPFQKTTHHSQLREDGLGLGQPKRGGSESLFPPIPLPRTMAGGTEVDYVRPLRPGETLSCQSEVVDIVEKQGRQGPLVITTTATTYRDEKNEIVVIVQSKAISR